MVYAEKSPRTRALRVHALSWLTLLVLAACGGGGGGASSTTPATNDPTGGTGTGTDTTGTTGTTTTSTTGTSTGTTVSGLPDITVTPSASTVALSWPAVTDSALYRVFRLDSASASVTGGADGTASEALAPVRTEVCQTTETSCVDGVDQSLTENTTYRYEVEARKNDGTLIATNTQVQGSTLGRDVAPDSSPELASAAVASASSLTLRWNAVRGASYYVISGGNFAGEKKVVGTSVVDTGLDPAATYTYRLKACNALNVCSATQSVTVNARGATVSVPAAPSVVLGQAYANSLSLTWRPVAWAQTYKLSRNGTEVAGALTTTAFTDTGLASGTAYSYTLQACNSLGCSPLSAPLRVSTVVVYPVQAQVTGLDSSRSGAELSVSATLGAKTEVLTVKAGTTVLGAIAAGNLYALRIVRQPANGQSCTVAPAGARSAVAGTNTAAISCLTPVALTYPQASVTLPLTAGVAQAAPQNPVAQVGTTVLSPAPTTGWTYASSNPAVVRVGTDGALTPVAAGSAQISTALASDSFTSSGKSAVYSVTIAAPPPPPPTTTAGPGTATPPAAQTVAVSRLDLTQVFAQEPGSTYEVLVPGRQVMVRAYLKSATASAVKPPAMTVTATGADGATQQLDMLCPATVPGTDSTADIYSATGACTAVVTNLALVKKGMTLTVASSDGSITRTLTPRVNTKGVMNIVMVPVKVGADLAPLPALADASAAMLRTMPFASVKMSAGSTYVSPNTGTDAQLYHKTLGEMLGLSNAEGGKRHWYGVMPKMVPLGGNSYLAGLGYVGGNAGVAVGVSGERVFLHEVGHNLNLGHAPCGVSASDANYTKELWTGSSQGLLSSTPIFDSSVSSFTNPLLGTSGANTDIMGYCNGKWFSEYGYRRAADYVQGNTSQKYVDQGNAGAVATGDPVLYVSGSISTSGQVSFNPTQLFQAGTVSDEGGDYILRVQTRNGAIYEQRFQAQVLGDDASLTQLFGIKIPRLDDIARMDVLYGGNLLSTQAPVAPATVTAQGVSGPVATTVTAAGATLQLRWDSRRWPWAALTHVSASGERTALVARATLGLAPVALPADLAAGGRWEVSLSDGLNSRVDSVPR